MGILYRAQTLVCSRRASTIAHIYPSVLQALVGWGYAGYELPRKSILGCSVNKGKITLSALTIHREFIASAYNGAGQGANASVAPSPATVAFALPIIQGVRCFSAGPQPKARRGYGGICLPEVLCDNCVRHRTGGSRGSGQGLVRPLRKPYLKSHS